MNEDLIITKENYNEIAPKQALPPEILRKIYEFWLKIIVPHDINKKKFDTIYVTSDIHADVYKLNRLLSSAGLISTTGNENRDDIFNNLNWLKPRTLLVIIGDIVDGARREYSEIYDDVGDIELILHVYLYNLRIKAQQVGSDIRFTIGNHDYQSVIKPDSTEMPTFYDAWVHKSAREFFGSRDIRRSCLLPFYDCCHYIILRVGDELAFVHGGLHADQGVNMARDLVRLQEKIDKEGDFKSLKEPDNLLLSNVRESMLEGGPLWTRFYSFGEPADVCKAVVDPFKMVIVGHCQTDSCNQGPTMQGILQNPVFNDCRDGGCVLLGCDKEEAPSLSFVDISMSSAFRNPVGSPPGIAEKSRRAELLKFEHDDALDTSTRYYNKISREKVGGIGPNESLVYWQAKPKTVGGNRKTNRSKKKNIKKTLRKYKQKNNHSR